MAPNPLLAEYPGKLLQSKRFLLLPGLLMVTTLACVTNTPLAQVSPPPPTRTPLPTFTITPIPPTPLPTPTFTPTSLATDTPLPTPTPLPPTNTPIPTDTPPPTAPPPPPPTAPPPPPPTNTPVPAPPPANTSPIATPTNTPEPGTPPGRYEIRSEQQKNDCANIGVYGKVREKGSDRPVQFVTIEVRGDDEDFKGPYIGKSNQDGRYDIFISGIDQEDIDGTKFEAKVVGAGVESEDTAEWEVSLDCHDEDAIQVYEINWDKK